jgi:hypothetical protein
VLTKEQLADIAQRPTQDVNALLQHIKELMQRGECEHNWQFIWGMKESYFQCSHCEKRKDKL